MDEVKSQSPELDQEVVSMELYDSLNIWCEEQLLLLNETELCEVCRAIDIRTARVKNKSKFAILKEIGTTVDKKRDESMWLAFLLLKIIKKQIIELRGTDLNQESDIDDNISSEQAGKGVVGDKTELTAKSDKLSKIYRSDDELEKDFKDYGAYGKLEDSNYTTQNEDKNEFVPKFRGAMAHINESEDEVSSVIEEVSESEKEDQDDAREERVVRAAMAKLALKLEEIEYKKKSKKVKVKRKRKDDTLTKSDLTDIRKAWRPPFKIIGQIGRIGQKDKLDFISLKRQIEAAKDKDPPYSDTDIIEAVIRATTAGTQLRTFLESFKKNALTLGKLIEILESYYHEADNKDLFRQLATLKQESNEDAQTFVMRGLELMHLLLADKGTGKLMFDPETVEEILRESLDTGFISDSIRNHLQPYLRGSRTFSEVELMRKVSVAMKCEKERKSKFEQKKKVQWGTIQEIKVQDVDNKVDRERNEKTSSVEKSDLSAVTALINEVRAEVSELKTTVGSQKNFRGGQYRVQYGCSDCKKKDIAKSCRHCFKCGASGHMASDCTKASKDKGSLSRDEQ